MLGGLWIGEVAECHVRTGRQRVDGLAHDLLRPDFTVVVVQRVELQERERLREVDVLSHDRILEDLTRVEDVRDREVRLVALLEQRPAVCERHRVVVDVHHARFRLDSCSITGTEGYMRMLCSGAAASDSGHCSRCSPTTARTGCRERAACRLRPRGRRVGACHRRPGETGPQRRRCATAAVRPPRRLPRRRGSPSLWFSPTCLL